MKPESKLREKREALQSEIDTIEEKIEDPNKNVTSEYEFTLRKKARQQVAMLDWVLEND